MACKTIQAQDQEAHYRVDAGIENGWRSPISHMLPLAENVLNKQLKVIRIRLEKKNKKSAGWVQPEAENKLHLALVVVMT